MNNLSSSSYRRQSVGFLKKLKLVTLSHESVHKVKSYEHKSKEGERALLSQLEKGKKLSESDLCSLVQCYCVEEATTDIDRIALREYVRTISKLGDRFFATDWERGLKDFDDLYYMQPFEVQLEEYEKTIKVREWNEK